MAILNLTSDGLPSVLVALYRTLAHERATSEDSLRALVCPPTLDAEQKKVGPTLNRWTQIGLFVEEGDQIALNPVCKPSSRELSVTATELRTHARRLVLQADNNDDLATETPQKGADFTYALAWALLQDIYTFPGGAHEQIEPIESSQFSESDSDRPFQNDTRWNGFKHWAVFLGFGWTDESNQFVLDPTLAVEAQLPQIFGGETNLPIAMFVERLSQHLPVIDGGRYQNEVKERLAPQSLRLIEDHQVSPALSLALLQLQAKGSFALESRSDAPRKTLLGRRFLTLKDVSHIGYRNG
jgi:hypothetical protein